MTDPQSPRPSPRPASEAWPALPYEAWADTLATLHRISQIVGKVRLAQAPWVNHSWHVPLYLTARGLTTSAMPHGARTFEMRFDFLDHVLRIEASDGGTETVPLEPRPVADTWRAVIGALDALDLPVPLRPMPSEIPDAVPLDRDREHAAYDAEAVTRFWRGLAQAERVLQIFRARFCGKCSPVHFFWGSFDLAVTRFSGRTAPPHPGGFPNLPDWVAREAYSHEVSSAGFWPGGAAHPEAVFYAYAYPTPDGFSAAKVEPAEAHWLDAMGEFVLPYEAVRTAADPDAALLAFLQSTYEATAEAADWDREALELGDPRARFGAGPA